MKVPLEKRDYFIFAGLPCLWVGLFLSWGVGVSLSVIGGILIIMGVFGADK